MKILFTILFFFICTFTYGLNKYVDSTGGNDSNNGNSPGTAYKSITKINQIMSTLTAGDSILLKRGEVWHNTIYVNKSGIHFGAYGSGSKPIISGMVSVSGWTNTSGNIWQSDIIGGTNTYMSMVTISDVATAMGRWPNANAGNGGYAVYDTTPVAKSLTAIISVTAMPFNFTGMTLCMRKIADILGRETVTSISGSRINHENLTGTNYSGFSGYGYFIQNGLATLDAQNEWYFNPSTRRLHIYSTSSPTNVKISTIDTLVLVGAFDNVTFDDIAFEGGNVSGISAGGPTLGNSTGTYVNRCDFVNMGRDGIYATANNNTVVDSCYFNHIMSNGIHLGNQGGNSVNATIKYNVLKNIGMRGMGFLDYANGFKVTYEGITNITSAVTGQLGMTVKFNSVDTVGHIGIRFFQNNTFIDSNYVNYHNYITDDAGAINTFDNFTGLVETNRTIIGNICNNGIGAGLGGRGTPNVNGIYVDDEADGIIIRRNFVGGVLSTVGSFDGSCIYIHNGTFIDILNNVNYNGQYAQITLAHDNHAIGKPLRNINVQNNLNFAKVNTAFFMVVRSRLNDIGQIFNPLNNNRYWRPTLITGATYQTVTNYQVSGQTVSNYTLPTWQTAFAGATNGPYDAASTQGASNTGATDIVWNFTNHDSTLNFNGFSYLVPQYNSPYQQIYNNSMVLAPYTGYIRIFNGVVTPVNKFPVANAGSDITIQLPTNQTNIIGTGSDSDGVIVQYQWAQITGPNTAVINPTSSTGTGTTNVSGLIAGTYFFQLTVTDNNGATGTSSMRVIVQPAINVNPTANAGVDQGITLPTSTTTLSGSGNDPDGSIVSFAWIKISGPSGGNITSPSSATTGVTALQQGTYVFQLTVTDNSGGTGSDLMQVVVSPANVAPTANAGADQTIMLPTNSVTLVGSGSDPDGTIASYAWTKISGPTGGSITSPSSATTGITALQQGTYVFRLTVTDNLGLTGSDFVQVIVQPANLAPTANAGTDQTIMLPTSTTTLVGSGTDPDGTIASYAWVKISGPSGGNITSPSSATTGITSLQQGTYVFRLTVTDNLGLTGSDFVQVVVNPANIAPTANAGIDQSITLPTSTATLTGSGTDPDGTIASYAWVKISGPSGGTITSASSASTGVTALQEGTYVFRLTVTDNLGLTGSDFMQIVVNPVIPPVNTPPTAVAGNDQIITLPTSTTTLDGSGSFDTDGTITGYLWTKISGPSGGSITTTTNAITGITGLIAGAYVYQLRVIDNNGDTATDAIQVTVFPAPIAPTADAGVNQTIQLPTNTATLTGSGTDPDGTIVGYLWTKISGPSGGAITSSTSATTGITGLLQGDYFYQLRVTDNSGDTATDVVQITVLPAPLSPTANAGADQGITLPTSTTTLVGSGTDPDGTIVAYLWTKINGPSGGAITSPTASTTGITGLIAGDYFYQLRVTDNSGDTATDVVHVTVFPAPIAPIADAGANQIIQLPTNSTTLVGSGTDPDGSIVAYLWTKDSGPTGGAITSSTSATTGITGLTEGIYVYRLRVTDNVGDTASDAVQITVLAAPIPVAPVANAGTDQTITLPVNSVTLSGSGTDSDGTIVSHVWTLFSGPTGSTISTPNNYTTLVSNLVEGTYLFQLTVTDNDGLTGTDLVQIIVRPVLIQQAVYLRGYRP